MFVLSNFFKTIFLFKSNIFIQNVINQIFTSYNIFKTNNLYLNILFELSFLTSTNKPL